MGALGWDEVASRLHEAPNWWVATSGSSGPHTVPVWGVVVGQIPSFYGAPDAVRSRNLAGDPRLVVHLESASDVLILHGTAASVGPAGADLAVNAAYAAKYTDPSDLEYLPDAPGHETTLRFAVTPLRAVAWRLGSSAEWENRRWSAEG